MVAKPDDSDSTSTGRRKVRRRESPAFVQNLLEGSEVRVLLKNVRTRLPRFKAWYNPPASSARGGLGIAGFLESVDRVYQRPETLSTKRPDPFDALRIRNHWSE